MKSLLRVVLYLRCSDSRQDKSIEDQRAECIAYAKKHNMQIVGEYVDDGISGDDTENRVAFLAMRDDAGSGTFAAVLCFKDDRFGRFDAFDYGHWIYPFRRNGIVLHTVLDGQVDWTSMHGRVKSVLDQEQKHEFLRSLSQNVYRGVKTAAKAGSWPCQPPYAYVLEGPKKQKRMVLGDPNKTAVVRRVFHEFVELGFSMCAIAKGLNASNIKSPRTDKWRPDTIKAFLRNPAYVGTFLFNVNSRSKYNHLENGEITKGGRPGRNPESEWFVFEDHHVAIVDRATFDRAQVLLARCKTGRSPHPPGEGPYLLGGGLLRCGKCGAPMHGRDSQRRGFRCSASAYDGDDACVGSNAYEPAVLQMLAEYIEDEFLPVHDQARLHRIMRSRELTEADLPEGFKKLRAMVADPKPPRVDSKRTAREVAKLENLITDARRNLAHVSNPANIPAVEAEIQQMVERCAELRATQVTRPDTKTVDDYVRLVINSLVGLYSEEPERVRGFVRNLDSITVFTETTGTGRGRRHRFERVEIKFRQLGGVTGKAIDRRRPVARPAR